MLKRLKNAARNQQENKSAASNYNNSAAPIDEKSAADENNSSSSSHDFHEGIMCPECRKTFETVDQLQQHYESSHGFPTSVENGGAAAVTSSPPLVTTDSGISSPDNAYSSNEKLPLQRNVSDLSSFVCPACFQELTSAEGLKSHFAAMHSNESENRDVDDTLAMRQEINDLRTTLKEEKRYANDMKKEVETLHRLVEENTSKNVESSAIAAGGKPGFENESMYYLQQIQMLEAGKALMTTKMLELERQVSELNRSQDATLREKDRILEKSLSIARENASLKSKYDEEISQRSARESRIQELKTRVEDLETALDQRPSDDDVAVLRKELIHAQTLMNDVAQESEREMGNWVNKCGQLETTCSKQESKISSLTDELSESRMQLERLQRESCTNADEEISARSELESQIAMLKKEISDHASMTQKFHDTISALNSQLEEMTATNGQLKLDLSGGKERETNLKLEIERKAADEMENTRRLEEAEERIRRLTGDREEILKSMEDSGGKSSEIALSQLTTENASLTTNLRNLENQAAEEKKLITGELKEKNAALTKLEKELSSLKIDTTKSIEKISRLESDNDRLAKEMKQKEKSMIEIREKFDETKRKLEESKKCESLAHESIMQLTKMHDDLMASKREWEAKMASVEHRANELSSEKDALVRLRDQDACTFGEERSKLEIELARANSLVEEEKTRLITLENRMKELSEEFMRLKLSNDHLSAEKADWEEERANLKEEAERLKESEAGLNEQLMELNNRVNEMAGEKNAISESKDELAGSLKTTETQAAELRAQLDKVEEILRVTREETEEIIREKEEELERALDELNRANLEKVALEETKCAEIESLKEERAKLSDELKLVKSTSEKRDHAYEELLARNVHLEEASRKNDEEIEAKDKKINALLIDRDMRTEELRKAKEESEKLNLQLQGVRSDLVELESKMGEEKAQSSNRISELEEEIVLIKNQSELSRQEFASKDADYNEQLRSLADTLSDMRSRLATCSDKLQVETSRSGALENRLADLERQSAELAEEKRVLLEKCLLNERDAEEERDNCKELHRRLDDAVSALYELGREHQSFQVDINRHFNRRWADDTAVHTCTKCTKPFTVTVRKHHCRNCGLIFCAECSNKTSYVAVSKKPVRVCDSCYEELQAR